MNETIHDATPSSLTTDRLRELLPGLLANERDGLVAFLIHLAEFDARRGWEDLNYPSLWDFCARELKLQKSCIYRRTNAARVIQRFPRTIDLLRSGAVTMTTLVVLKDVLTDLNAESVLARAEWKSKEEVEAIAAELAPKAAPAPMIRRLPTPATSAVAAPSQATPARSIDEPAAHASEVTSAATPTRIEAVALDGANYSFRGVANQEFTDKLRRAQEILSHAVPNGDPIQVLSRALDLLIEQHAKTVAEPVRPRAEKRAATTANVTGKRSRHIPAAIARAVRRRDEGCCSFKLPDGTRCGSRWKLELDHIKSFALGGESTLENLRLACGAHNAVHARRTFGNDVVARHRPKETRTQ